MFKVILALLINLCLITGAIYAEETFTISGELTFQYEEDIYVCLHTSDTYKEMRMRNPTPPYLVIIKMDAETKKAGKASFEFTNIPKGIYCIIAYQDSIKNEKIDLDSSGAGAPADTWGCYKPLPPQYSNPHWPYIKFELDQNLTGIEIQI